jgi:hypothetical protein
MLCYRLAFLRTRRSRDFFYFENMRGEEMGIKEGGCVWEEGAVVF